MPHLVEALESGFNKGINPQIKGREFEHALKQALTKHPGDWGKARFSDVWLWNQWPGLEDYGYTRQDKGIDLVARLTDNYDGGLVAIQAKYGSSTVSTTDVNNFLAYSGNDYFAERILVVNQSISKNGEDNIERAKPRCRILRLNEIDSWVDDWREYIPNRIDDIEINIARHELRPYQEDALHAIRQNFVEKSRGKLILPCGTGKSFVALKAAEENAGLGKTVLYLVPSISLMGQTMREWSRQRSIEHQYIGICSDVTTGKSIVKDPENYVAGQLAELTMPVTTDAAKITSKLAEHVPHNAMRVIFSTYHSSSKIMDALQTPSLAGFEFDFVLCDEAHRTTGIEAESTKEDGRARTFQIIHNDERIRGKKRLYMTATPRVFAENIRKRMAEQAFDGQAYSMDDEETYGPEVYRMSFADAIYGNWLSDYRVVVIGVSEDDYLQRAEDNPIRFEDGKLVDPETVVRLAGCWDALATPESKEISPQRDLGALDDDLHHARTAIAFSSRIRESKLARDLWTQVAEWHKGTSQKASEEYLRIDVAHVDANTPASERSKLIEELRVADKRNHAYCRVLSNVGVLSEGVDVPALDAVVFLQSRSSPVDVTQAVGRVMRKAEGKEFGYVVIPVVVPQFHSRATEDSVENLLEASDFKPVWDVVRALRSHDERIDHMLEAGTMPIQLRIPPNRQISDDRPDPLVEQPELALVQALNELNDRFSSLMLEVCGDRHMYPNWGKDAGKVCKQIELRLHALIDHHSKVAEDFDDFHTAIHETVSRDVSQDQAIRMVAQHLVTVPVFDELFGDSHFADRNPITQSFAVIVESLEKVGADFSRERLPLNRGYHVMNQAFRGAQDPSKRLDVIREIFDGFFRQAMPDEVKTMGIAYTPIELVDFVIKFVDKLYRLECGRGLTDKDVHILDPFAGTGSFLTHLLECTDDKGNDIIRDDDLNFKYAKELHANELVLLAYYIAALKIEETKHQRSMSSAGSSNAKLFPYEPFDHIVLTDTFHLLDSAQELSDLFGDFEYNTLRAMDQLKVPIHVILGNPPWSSGKDDASEQITNLQYPEITGRVIDTYGRAHDEVSSRRKGGNAGGNLYVKAFRWATDRIIQNDDDAPAIVAFVTPNSLTDGTSLAGMRKVLRDEFTDIYVVNLRGNAYKAGDESKKEGEKIFGAASRNGVQITFLVRNPRKNLETPANLHYAMVPQYSTLKQKFEWLEEISGPQSELFESVPVTPTHDWIDLQDPEFHKLFPVCKSSDKDEERAVVNFDCAGVKTNCDTYVYAFSLNELQNKVQVLIHEFNECRRKYEESGRSEALLTRMTSADSIQRIKWTDTLKNSLRRGKSLQFDPRKIREVLYRPFTKCFLYVDFDILSAGKSAVEAFPIDESTEQMYPPRKTTQISRNIRRYHEPTSLRTHSSNYTLQPRSNRAKRKVPQQPAILTQAPTNRARAALCATNLIPDLNVISPTLVMTIGK